MKDSRQSSVREEDPGGLALDPEVEVCELGVCHGEAVDNVLTVTLSSEDRRTSAQCQDHGVESRHRPVATLQWLHRSRVMCHQESRYRGPCILRGLAADVQTMISSMWKIWHASLILCCYIIAAFALHI